MDLEEWELVSDEGFDVGGKKHLSSSNSNQFVESKLEESVLLRNSLSIQLDDPISDHPIVENPDVVVNQLTTNIATVPIIESAAPSAETGEQDPILQVFDKKTEFADMKIDSGSTEFLPQIETGAIEFEEKGNGEDSNSAGKPMAEKEEEGVDLWKGVGAICSFGMAAATICIMIFGNAQTNKHNQNLRIQIYSDDKRMNQVVEQATKLNEAISSAVRVGLPLTRAHITSGGYYDGL